MVQTIQSIAQKMLLAFYKTYRQEGNITDGHIQFRKLKSSWKFSTTDSKLKGVLLAITENDPNLLKQAIEYLHSKGLIDFQMKGNLSSGAIIYQLTIPHQGIDMIEGVSGPGKSKAEYENTFNVTLAPNITIESLIKTELKGSILSLL